MRGQRSMWDRVAIAGAGLLLLGGCTLHYQDFATGQSETFSLIGKQAATETVSTLPGHVHFACGGISGDTPMYRIPGDVNAIVGNSGDAVATTGIERNAWALVVNRLGTIGWIPARFILPYGAVYPGASCHVHQDSQGRIVFTFYHKGYRPHIAPAGL
ncbi:MAG: hypothetical protein JO122_08215 [Acetobacteraceae bacterium]|nr:hypothetical protein [Acetobacteraceae bacterium]